MIGKDGWIGRIKFFICSFEGTYKFEYGMRNGSADYGTVIFLFVYRLFKLYFEDFVLRSLFNPDMV